MPAELVSPVAPSLPGEARAAVLAWFDARGRSLNFRGTRDPYAVLVSEVMAQQTQISRVVAAWSRFLERFPTVRVLAASSPADVLRAWQGMGYDRRALNLLHAARIVVAEHRGQLPRDIAALERLPGVGPYTARAIASIAFGEPVGAVDTNVRRVLGRALDIEAATPARLQDAADASVDRERPGEWTHAVMDIGATVCRPRSPRCAECPLRTWCAWRLRDGTSPSRSMFASPRREPFASTGRWLRGRIVDQVRRADGETWTTLDAPIGNHDLAAVSRALAGLARDGIVELDPESARRARLATD